MVAVSEIEWTDVTWNPVAGCTLASAGCTNCYAMRMAARLQAMGHDKYKGTTRKSGGRYVWTGRVNIDHASLSAPLEWRRPKKKIFVNSMSDLFHEAVPDDFIQKVWAVMAECPSKAPLPDFPEAPHGLLAMVRNAQISVIQNAWLGTSVESEEVTDRVKHSPKLRRRHSLFLLNRLSEEFTTSICGESTGLSSVASSAPGPDRWMKNG